MIYKGLLLHRYLSAGAHSNAGVQTMLLVDGHWPFGVGRTAEKGEDTVVGFNRPKMANFNVLSIDS